MFSSAYSIAFARRAVQWRPCYRPMRCVRARRKKIEKSSISLVIMPYCSVRWCGKNSKTSNYKKDGITFHSVAAKSLLERPSWLANVTSCEEFERDAYFNPVEVVDSMWKIFYFWAESTEMTPVILSLLSNKRIRKLKAVVDAVDPELGVQWARAAMVMEPRLGLQIVLLHQDTPAAYRALLIIERRDQARPYPKPLINFADVRLKQVGRIIGFMSCEELTGYAMARVREMPVTEADCVAAAQALGYHGRGGKSYLYVKSIMKTEL